MATADPSDVAPSGPACAEGACVSAHTLVAASRGCVGRLDCDGCPHSAEPPSNMGRERSEQLESGAESGRA